MKRPLVRVAALCIVLTTAGLAFRLTAQSPTPRHVHLNRLTPYQSDLYTRSMDLAAQSFDAEANLIVRPTRSNSNARSGYMVRESSWYTLGLLLRDKPGDRDLAATILRTILASQYRTPGVKWYGTFKRSPEDKEPKTGDAAFTTYDPNWRHFIGTVFQMILIEYPDRISTDLAKDLKASIEIAVAGEMQDGRLKESYSNIALMYGALWESAAVCSNNRVEAKGRRMERRGLPPLPRAQHLLKEGCNRECHRAKRRHVRDHTLCREHCLLTLRHCRCSFFI